MRYVSHYKFPYNKSFKSILHEMIYRINEMLLGHMLVTKTRKERFG